MIYKKEFEMGDANKKNEGEVKTRPETKSEENTDNSENKDKHGNGSCCGVCGG